MHKQHKFISDTAGPKYPQLCVYLNDILSPGTPHAGIQGQQRWQEAQPLQQQRTPLAPLPRASPVASMGTASLSALARRGTARSAVAEAGLRRRAPAGTAIPLPLR